MFFSTFVLTKKGPLAKVWLAAHWDKKLTAREYNQMDLNETIMCILEPEIPLALRTSGELMLGCFRIYALKVNILLKDSTDAETLLLRQNTNQPVKLTTSYVTPAKGQPVNTSSVGGSGASGHPRTEKRIDAAKLSAMAFADLDDILGETPMGVAAALSQAAGSTDWLAVDLSQFSDAASASQRMDAEGLERLRISRMEFENTRMLRGTSGSSGTFKSSQSSIEASRDVEGMMHMDDPLDIGMALPEGDADDGFGAFSLETPLSLGDPFLQGELFPTPAAQVTVVDGQAESGLTKKSSLRRLQLMDERDVVFNPRKLNFFRENTREIVPPERRRGAMTLDEAGDRRLLHLCANTSGKNPLIHHLEPLGYSESPALYALHVQQSVADTIEEIEALRGKHTVGAAGRYSTTIPTTPGEGPGIFDTGMDQFENQFPELPEGMTHVPTFNQKRSRDEELSSELSLGANQTLERTRNLLSKQSEIIFGSAVAGGCSRFALAQGLVHTLTLASRDCIKLNQERPLGPILISASTRIDQTV